MYTARRLVKQIYNLHGQMRVFQQPDLVPIFTMKAVAKIFDAAYSKVNATPSIAISSVCKTHSTVQREF